MLRSLWSQGHFFVKEWLRGDRVKLEKNPHFWQADKVSLDGVEWISIPDDNTRMLKVQAGELDSAIFVPFFASRCTAQGPQPDHPLRPFHSGRSPADQP